MKCPKCDYLGFETGDRCKNCGYDFSLIAAPTTSVDDLPLSPSPSAQPDADLWLEGPDDAALESTAHKDPLPEPSYPLFASEDSGDEQPLITLPATPRAPLSVRRTPDLARHRTAPRSRKIEAGLTLEFAEEVEVERPAVRSEPAMPPIPRAIAMDSSPADGVASLGSRVVAALIDHTILLGIDLVVVYGTLKMTALTMSEWQSLPAVPLVAFLLLIKFAYFSAFTAMGGQTIGKMAAGIRVVSDDDARLEPARAVSRTLTGAVSLLSFGLGLIPALISQERRAFHDRIAHTRVIHLPSA